jgi:hypothetical protein
MAKHPHQLLLVDKKTWKCIRENCSFFVHLGLAHILIGKAAICWNCEGVFTIAQWSLNDEKPICDECRSGVSDEVLEKYGLKEGEDNE